MGEAIVADVRLTLERLLDAVGESDRDPASRARADRAAPESGPDQRHRGDGGARRRLPRGRDRRPRGAVEHARAAQPAAPLAARQLLLRRRRRARLRPLRRGRRPARAARPPGRLRRRRGLGPVRDHRASGAPSAYDVPVTFLVLRNSEYAILKWFSTLEQVEGAPGLDLPALDTAAIADGLRGPARAGRERRGAARARSASAIALGQARSWSRSGSRPACGSPRARRSTPHRARERLAGEPGRARPPGSRPARRSRCARELVALLGADRVLTRASDLIRYASDASPYRLIPKAVVMAARRRRRRQLIAYARRTGTPLTFRAGGTSLNGQAPDRRDPRRRPPPLARDRGARRTARAVRVKPGTVLGHVNRVLAPYGRKLGPDPASTDIATVGGVIANNSGGMRCGVVRDSYSTVRALTFVLPSGTVIDTARPTPPSRLRRGRARARRRPRRDPRRDPRRRRAARADPPQVRDQEHDRLPALRLPRRRRRRSRSSAACWSAPRERSPSSPRRSSTPCRSRPTTTALPGSTSRASTRRRAGARPRRRRARARSS